MEVSFIIINYHTEKYLPSCVCSIEKMVERKSREIIIVNNGCKKNRIISEVTLRQINSPKNIGFGSACNLGAREASGDILCFLNPDTEIMSTNISELLLRFKENENLGVIGAKLISETGKIQEWIAGYELSLFSTFLNNLGYKRDKKIWQSQKPVECDWVSGASMFVRKKIFDELGGFDEDFFLYFEDVDLCKRVKQAGYKVLYYPTFIVRHYGGRSFLNRKIQKRYYRRSQKRFFLKKLLNKK